MIIHGKKYFFKFYGTIGYLSKLLPLTDRCRYQYYVYRVTVFDLTPILFPDFDDL